MNTQAIQDFLNADLLTLVPTDDTGTVKESQLTAAQKAAIAKIDAELIDLQHIAEDLMRIANEYPDDPSKVMEYAQEHYGDVMDRVAQLLSDIAAAKANGNPAVSTDEFDRVLQGLQNWVSVLAAYAGHVSADVLAQAQALLKQVQDASPDDLNDPTFNQMLSAFTNWVKYFAGLNPDSQEFKDLSNLVDQINQTKDEKAPKGAGAGTDPDVPSFAWVKIYSSVSLWSMPGTMIDNSNAIQSYIYNGLQGLSLEVMQSSQAWSSYWMDAIQTDQSNIQDIIKNVRDPNERSSKINAATTTFNMHNTQYQQFLQWYNSLNDGVNNVSSNTTQTQTQDNSNIGQGPLALIQTLTNIWSVIA